MRRGAPRPVELLDFLKLFDSFWKKILRNTKMAQNPWPADRVERRPLASLMPSARNARTHSEAQIGQIAASIGEWGWTMPVLDR